MLCEDSGKLIIDEMPKDDKAYYFNRRNSQASSHAGTGSMDATAAVNDVVIAQPRPVVQLVTPEGAETGEIQSDDSGYETMNGVCEAPEQGTETDQPMPVVEMDGEAAPRNVFNSINIYCVCCSKQVESPANLKNRLCKQCIDIMEDDGANESTLYTVSVPCAICSKCFEKSRNEQSQLCKECTSIVLEECENELGVSNKAIVGCSVCHRPLIRLLDRVRETLCLHCEYVRKKEPAPMNAQRRDHMTANAEVASDRQRLVSLRTTRERDIGGVGSPGLSHSNKARPRSQRSISNGDQNTAQSKAFPQRRRYCGVTSPPLPRRNNPVLIAMAAMNKNAYR